MSDQLGDNIKSKVDEIAAGEGRTPPNEQPKLIPPPDTGPRTANPQEDITPESANRVTTLGSLSGQGDVVIVDEVVTYAPRVETGHGPRGFTKIRIGDEPIEDMTITAGGETQHYDFEARHEYLVPVGVYNELEMTGKLWH